MNYVCIVGRITKDPELKKSSQGNDVLRFVIQQMGQLADMSWKFSALTLFHCKFS